MQRLRTTGLSSIFNSRAVPQLRRKVHRSWAAVQDTYFSTKDLFERHRVVFTVGTSLASVAIAGIGYSLRHYHDTRVDQRLESIEKAMKNNNNLEHAELEKLVDTGHSKLAANIATTGTALIIGYIFGWRGGRWYEKRKFRQEQMKLLGQIKPKRWPLLCQIKPGEWRFHFLRRQMELLGQMKPSGWRFQFLRRRTSKLRLSQKAVQTSEKMLKKDSSTTHNSQELHRSC